MTWHWIICADFFRYLYFCAQRTYLNGADKTVTTWFEGGNEWTAVHSDTHRRSLSKKMQYSDGIFKLLDTYLLRLRLPRIRNIIMTLASIPSPATRKMIPEAVSAFSLHSMSVPLVTFLVPSSSWKTPAPGMPLETVFVLEDDIFTKFFVLNG